MQCICDSVCVTVRLQTRRYAACSDHRGRYAACSDHRGRYAACSDHRGRYAACVSLGEPLRGIRYCLTPESGRFSRVGVGRPVVSKSSTPGLGGSVELAGARRKRAHAMAKHPAPPAAMAGP